MFSCGENDKEKENTKKNSLFIIPQDSMSYICRMDKESIIVIDSIQSSLINLNSIIVNDEYIFTFENNNTYESRNDASVMKLYDLRGNLIKDFDESSKLSVTCSNSRNQVIYLGGDSRGEIFAMIDCNEMELSTINLPIRVHRGKSIDDILLINNKMILVDNIVFPKYLFEYDISYPSKPKHIKTEELKNHGTYEHIIKGDINNDWLVLLSSSVGDGGSSNHITIKGKTNGHISSHHSHRNKGQMIEDVFYKDICLIDETLYLLGRDGRVSKINLNDKIEKSNIKYIKTQSESIIKLIKSPNNSVVAVSRNEFELIK